MRTHRSQHGRPSPAFSLIEVLIAVVAFLCLLLPLYFVFFSTTRGVEGSVRQLQAVTYASQVMAQIIGTDEQQLRLWVRSATTQATDGSAFVELEPLLKQHGDAGIPLESEPWLSMVKSRIFLSEVPAGFERGYRARRVVTTGTSVNFTPANLVEVSVRVRYPRPGANEPAEYVLSALLARPATWKCRKDLGMP